MKHASTHPDSRSDRLRLAACAAAPLVAAFWAAACASGATLDSTGAGDPGGNGGPTGCPSPFERCGGDCVDPRTDEDHCGACGEACDPGEVCVDGTCEVTCGSGLVGCGGSCIDPLSDPDHCGASGSCKGADAGAACEQDEACVDGACSSSCPGTQVRCGQSCIDPLTDPDFCGASGDCAGPNAGVACGPATSACPGAVGEICQGGQCAPGCTTGEQTFVFTGSVATFPLPGCVTEIRVSAAGAQGGTAAAGSAGGLGAQVDGSVCVPIGSSLSVVVGEQPPSAPYPCGGGGGSFVARGNTALFVAGGGGGGYLDWTPGGSASLLATLGSGAGGLSHNNGGGGGGFTANGAGGAGSGGISFLNGAAGGVEYPLGNTNATRGGFGGGGGASESGTFNAGGGGGFDGGNAGNGNASTGGTSFMSAEAFDALFTPAVRAGHGTVTITW
jgi:hypothetical protein